MKRNYTFISFFVLSLIVGSCGSKESKKTPPAAGNRQPPGRVDGFIVKTQAVSENVEVPGTLIANEATEIHPEVSGRIVQLSVGEGRLVSRGAMLAKLY